MTRARAKAIEHKVNSLLSELPLSTHETWLLPQTETLCVLRYLEESHGASTSIEQGGKATDREGQEEDLPEKTPATGRPVGTGRPAPEAPAVTSQPTQAPARGRPARTRRPTTLSSEQTTKVTGRPTPPHGMEINGSLKPPDVRRIPHRTELAEVRRLRTSGPP